MFVSGGLTPSIKKCLRVSPAKDVAVCSCFSCCVQYVSWLLSIELRYVAVVLPCHTPIELTDAQLMSPGEPLCAGQEVVFSCEQPGDTAVWAVTLLSGRRLTASALSSNVGNPVPLENDPGLGLNFEVHVFSSSSSTRVFSELRVTAARELNGATVECGGFSGNFRSTIQIFLVGGFAWYNM